MNQQLTMTPQELRDSVPDLPELSSPVRSTKTFTPEVGLSCAFRQWRAHSHCRFLHGYALGIKLEFCATELDHCGWVVDFGGLKGFKQVLETIFDHKTLVAKDDPQLGQFQEMARLGIIDLQVVPATGCEAFARLIYDLAEGWLHDAGFSPRVWLASVEVSEHGANSAICHG